MHRMSPLYGFRRSLPVLLALVIALCSPVALSAATHNVTVGPSGSLTFVDSTSGTSTTTINVGDTVVWNWAPNGPGHSVTSGACDQFFVCTFDGLFNSGTFSNPHTFQFTFNTPGTFPYYCIPHGAAMTGQIIVVGSAAPTVRFNTAVSVTVDKNPIAIAAADLDHDGKLDLVTASGTNGSVSIMHGLAGGAFAASTTTGATGGQATTQLTSLAAADLRQTNTPDVIVTDATNLVALPGNGDTTFGVGAAIALTGISNVKTVATGKLDNNAFPDVVVGGTHGTSSGLLFFAGNGQGGFGKPATITTSSNDDFVLIGDLNGDNKQDLVVIHQGANSIGSLTGVGDGTFNAEVTTSTGTFTGPMAAALRDFNGDNIPDLAVVNSTTQVAVYPGAANGTFGAPVMLTTGSSSVAIAVADINGDGKMDIITANSGGTVSIFLGNGNGTFLTKQDFNVGSQPTAIVIGDFNGDGAPDIAVSVSPVGNVPSTVSVLLNQGGTNVGLGSSQLNATAGQSVTFTATVAASINGTGTPTGTVTFFDGATSLGAGTLGSGTATLNTSALTPGTHSITASYGGDSNFNPRVSAAISQKVQFTTTTTVISSKNPAVDRDSVTLTATVATQGSGATVATGNVNFTDGGDINVSSTLNGSGVATFSTIYHLGVGAPHTFPFTGNYVGDTTHFASSSSVLNQVVNAQGSFSTTALDFGSVLIGMASPAKPVTLTNNSIAALNTIPITAGGDFSETNNCGTSVAAGQNCSISVVFTPQALGSRTSTLTDTNAATQTNAVPVQLTGTGIDIVLSLARPVRPHRTAAAGSAAGHAQPAESADFDITVAGSEGAQGTVDLSCSGLPAGYGCVFSATHVDLETPTTIHVQVLPRRTTRLGNQAAKSLPALVKINASFGGGVRSLLVATK